MNNKTIILPQTIPEKLLYITVRLVCTKHDSTTSCGTGFLFRFPVNDSKTVELILTNKHVVKDCAEIYVVMHEAKGEKDLYEPLGKTIGINIKNFEDFLISHPNENVDLAAIKFAPIRQQIKFNLNKSIFCVFFDKEIIKSDIELLEYASVAETVLMVGYPIGLADEINNFPLIRKGITATHPAIDFQGRSIGVVDIACFPGSSGSPIILYIDGSYSDKAGNILLGTKILLFGLLTSGPIFTSEGRIDIKEIPSSILSPVAISQQMIHLGYYIKAKEILILCEHIRDKFGL